MRRQHDGTYVPFRRLSNSARAVDDEALASACPFSPRSISEDQLSKQYLPDAETYHGEVGAYIGSHVVHVTSEGLRASSSSGGFARWLLRELLEEGCVTHVAHVTRVTNPGIGGALFRFDLTKDPGDVLATATSAYYPVNLETIIPAIKELEGTVAITAIPCFAKAIRQVCLQDSVLREKVKVIVGIVCGHMKSRGFAELLAWQVGVPPKDLGGVDFRKKLPNLPANQKGFVAYDLSTLEWTDPVNTKSLIGGDWGVGLLKNPACEFCDDVLAEVADVSIGDAWLPEYTRDPKGHSIVVIRNKAVQEVFEAGFERGDLSHTEVVGDVVAKSQAGGLRHRREGLAFRLYMAESEGRWHPPKRVRPAMAGIPRRRQRIYAARHQLALQSLEAFSEAKDANDLSYFTSKIAVEVKRYNRLSRPWWWRVLSSIKRRLVR